MGFLGAVLELPASRCPRSKRHGRGNPGGKELHCPTFLTRSQVVLKENGNFEGLPFPSLSGERKGTQGKQGTLRGARPPRLFPSCSQGCLVSR